MTETWAEVAVDRLQALKLTGCAFESAWSVVLLENPIDWRRDFGIRGNAGSFDGMLEEQATERWLRDRFREAWEKDPATSRLRHLELPAQVAVATRAESHAKVRGVAA